VCGRLVELVRDIIKEVSNTFREEIRGIISEDVLQLLRRLGFRDVEAIQLDERFRIRVRLAGLDLDLDTLCEGIRNAMGVGMKLSAAKFLHNLPALTCFDGCLRLDPDRSKLLIGLLEEMGIRNIIITERAATPEVTVT